jgi:hypothetical protein
VGGAGSIAGWGSTSERAGEHVGEPLGGEEALSPLQQAAGTCRQDPCPGAAIELTELDHELVQEEITLSFFQAFF